MSAKRKERVMLRRWATPIGFPDYVKVSTDGCVKLEARVLPRGTNQMRFKEKILILILDAFGYVRVQFRVNGKNSQYRVHRLVLLAHSGVDGGPLDANHKNGIKSDNRIENLEWCSRSENIKHSYRELGRIPAMKGRTSPNKGVFNHISTSKKIIGVHQLSGEEIRFLSATDAGRNGFSRDGIAHCLIGDQRHSGGYVWRFA